MSERMRKLLTSDSIEIIVGSIPETKFIIPRSRSAKLITFIKSLQTQEAENILVPADQVFRSLDKKYGKIGATIRGLRMRDGLTQEALAKKLGIRQTHVSQMEHGKRSVGKKMAQKLAKIFHTNYRLFL
jgi:DNA-binding XRE family transcriptional regulator